MKGGKANIGDPVENIMRNFIHLIDAAQKNRAADMILQDMAKGPSCPQAHAGRGRTA